MKTTNIYTLTDPETQKIRYIGKANDISDRYSAHLSSVKKQQIHKKNWIAALKRKGLKPIIEIIDIVPIEEWKFWEVYWISQFKTWGFKLLNYTNGGDGCTFGNQTSFKKGHNNIPVLQINSNGEIINEYESTKLAKEKFGKDMTCSLDKKLATGGFLWLRKKTYDKLSKKEFNFFLKDFNNRGNRKSNSGSFKKNNIPWCSGKYGYKIGGKKKSKNVLQFDLNNVFIKKFLGCKEASLELCCDQESIRRACCGIQKTAKKFIWKYCKDK